VATKSDETIRTRTGFRMRGRLPSFLKLLKKVLL